jgi:hypothetical protein
MLNSLKHLALIYLIHIPPKELFFMDEVEDSCTGLIRDRSPNRLSSW